MTKIKPFLKWAGNKYRCLERITPHLPKAKRLIEPFAGSASIFLNTNYPNYILAEANNDVVSLFSFIKKEGEQFIDSCKELFVAENNCAETFYKFRERFNLCTNMRERAQIFLYLNKHGYNGLCRYNSKGIYNVPFGRFNKPYFPHTEMLLFAKKAQHAQFLHQDFTSTFSLLKKGDAVYCDPPYSPLNQNQRFDYIKPGFGVNEHQILRDLAISASKRGIAVIISNHDTEFTRDLYKESKIVCFKVNRSISCNPSQRLPAKELLAIFMP